MARTRPLDEALNCPSATFYCVAASGSELLPLPFGLQHYASRFDPPDAPLGDCDPVSFGTVVTAFLAAVTDGYGTTTARHVSGTDRRVEVFDRIEELGCVVVCVAETDEIADVDALPQLALPVRRMTSRMDASGRAIHVDEGITRLLGWSQDEYMGMSGLEKVHPDDNERALRSFAELLGRLGGQARNRQRVLHKDGTWRWFEITHTNLLHTDDPHVFAESYDISDEMQVTLELQEREALLRLLTESLPVGVLQLRPTGEADLHNESWTRLTGGEADVGLEDLLESLATPEAVRDAVEAARMHSVASDQSIAFAAEESPCRHADLAIRPLPSDEAPFSVLLTLTDTSESVETETHLRRESRYDHLTGVLNRLGIEERVESLLTNLTSERITLLYCDLNGFKAINDTHGHATGDAVLEAVACEIRDLLRPLDLVGRLGGDEFIVVLLELRPPEVRRVVNRIERQLSGLTNLLDGKCDVSVAIGSAEAKPGDDFKSLIRRADDAMYLAKSSAMQL